MNFSLLPWPVQVRKVRPLELTRVGRARDRPLCLVLEALEAGAVVDHLAAAWHRRLSAITGGKLG